VEYGKKQIKDQGNPYLDLDSVLTVRQKIISVQNLLDWLEKHFYDPSVLIKLGYGQCLMPHQIADKLQFFTALGI
jgi:hypothetical protein